jgi:hypothetical protein
VVYWWRNAEKFWARDDTMLFLVIAQKISGRNEGAFSKSPHLNSEITIWSSNSQTVIATRYPYCHSRWRCLSWKEFVSQQTFVGLSFQDFSRRSADSAITDECALHTELWCASLQ